MKLISQRNNSDCGPTALFNALRWAGYNFPIKELSNIKKLCDYTPKLGTFKEGFNSALKKLSKKFIKSKFRKSFTKKELFEHLYWNGAAIIVYIPTSRNNGHSALLYWHKGGIWIANDEFRKTREFTDQDLLNLFRQDLSIWLISKLS